MKCKNDYRDMDKFREYRNRSKLRYYGKTKNARNRYQKWTEEETAMILAREHTDTELSKILGRSVMSIQVKRIKTKRMEAIT